MARSADISFSIPPPLILGRKRIEGLLFGKKIHESLEELEKIMCSSQDTKESSFYLPQSNNPRDPYEYPLSHNRLRDLKVANPQPKYVWDIVKSNLPRIEANLPAQVPALKLRISVADTDGVHTHSLAFKPNDPMQVLIATAHDRDNLAISLIKKEQRSRKIYAGIHPLSYEGEELNNLLANLANKEAKKQYHTIATAIHSLQEKHATIESISEEISFNGKNVRINTGIPTTSVSALEVAHMLGMISDEEYHNAQDIIQQGGGQKTTRIIVQGHALGPRGGPVDEDIDTVIMKGLADIAQAVKKIKANEPVDIPDTEVHIISPIHAAGTAPDRATVKMLHDVNPYQTNAGWLDAQAELLTKWLTKKGVLSAKDEQGRVCELEGTSRGAYLVWRMSHALPDLTKTIYLNKPAGFHRMGEKLELLSLRNAKAYDGINHVQRHVYVQQGIGSAQPYTLDSYKNTGNLKDIEEAELLGMTVSYTEPPKSTVIVKIPDDDSIVYPFAEIKNKAGYTEDDIRNAIRAEFSQGGDHTEVIRIIGKHTSPHIRQEDIVERLAYLKQILPYADWHIFDPLFERNTTIELILDGLEESIFTTTITKSHSRRLDW